MPLLATDAFDIPRLTNALQRTTTLTLPGSSAMASGAMGGYGSDARNDGAEAVVCSPEYIPGCMISSNKRWRVWRSCRDLAMYSRCMVYQLMSGCAALVFFRLDINTRCRG
jgi:hypothetical protein